MASSFAFDVRHGEVATFDDFAGRGTIRDTDGREWFFHCTQIADGSRSIEVRAQVQFDVMAGKLGRWEAASVRPAMRPHT